MKPRRVLLVEANEDGTVGGSYRCMADIATNMDKRQYWPVALFYEPNWIAEQLAENGVDTRVWNQIRTSERRASESGSRARARLALAAAVWRRARFLRRERIALVHLNNSPDFRAFEWVSAAVLARVPVVAHCRGLVPKSPNRATAWTRSVFRRVIAISAHVRDNLLDAGFAPGKVELVYDGVDAAAVRRAGAADGPGVRAELGVPNDHLLGVMVGNMRRWKGQHVVLEALRRLPEAVLAKLRFVLVGGSTSEDHAYVSQLQALAADERLSSVVRFLGERRDPYGVMDASDFVVHASIQPEPFGLVVVEAMALGKPVIASRLGGPLETIAPGCGLLSAPGDPSELSTLMLRVIESPAERQAIAVRARLRAEDFSVERNIRAIDTVYRGVLGASSRSVAEDHGR